MKAHSALRVGADAVALLLAQLEAMSRSIVKAATAKAKKEGRTTIMAADVTAGLTTVTGSISDLPFLFRQLEALNARDTASLSGLIQTWLDATRNTAPGATRNTAPGAR